MRRKWEIKGFTLIELLVVISIIVLLLSIVMPALMRTRETARRTVCGGQLRQVGVGVYAYAQACKGYVPVCDGPNLLSWYGTIRRPPSSTPYLENFVLIANLPKEILYCPSSYMKRTGWENYWEHWHGWQYIAYSYIGNRLDDKQAPGRIVANYAGWWPEREKPAKKIDEKGYKLLFTDNTISNHNNQFPNDPISRENVTHWMKGRPWGNNQLYLDGHVNWVPFEKLKPHPVWNMTWVPHYRTYWDID